MAKRAWIIWYEDREGPGDRHVFKTKKGAEKRISDLLMSVLREVDDEWKAAEAAGKMDDLHERLKTLSQDIRAADRADKVWDALEEWRTFEGDDEEGIRDWFGTVKVEETVIAD